MKIVVVGAGEVGTHITSMLSEDGHDVILVEANPERATLAQNNLDAMVVEGNGASMAVLDQAGAAGADMIVAVTDMDEINIVACVSGKTLGIPRRIARVKNLDYSGKGADRSMREVGVDLMINPDLVAAQEIERLISLPGASDVFDFGGGLVRMVGLYVGEEAPVLRTPLKEIDSWFGPQPVTVVAVVRNGTTLIPDGDTILEAGDHAYLVGKRGSMAAIMEFLGQSVDAARNVMIVGAGPISRHLATHLVDHYKMNVKIVELKKKKAARVANELGGNIMMLHGDGTDVELLKSENIQEMDAFVAASNDEETNIMSCLLARHLGADKTFALIRRSNYVPLVPVVGIDAAVSVRLATASAVMKYCHRGEILSFTQLKDNEAQFLELVAHGGDTITRKPLSQVSFPRGAVVGAVIRSNQFLIPRGDTRIQDGDRVVIFALPKAVDSVERMF